MASSPEAAPCSSSTWVMEKVTGTHLFKIADYSLAKGIGAGNPISSATFDAGGFDWAIAFYPDGQDKASANHISLFLCLRSDAGNGVKAAFSLTLLDQRRPPPRQPGRYLKDDCLTIQCTVSVLKKPRLETPPNARPVSLPPSDLHRHLRELLESGDETDVTFEVCGETFPAHRLLLAARSPVFRAELFGPMKERSAKRIKIDDMETLAFRALLHFIYSDSLPLELEELAKEPSASMFQHLLAAADRYGLERLRLISEDRLCRNITVSTAATTLVLAEQHHCCRLKEACLEFLASPKSLIDVMKTDGFEHLKISCPRL
uniref:BTB/POZ and MATH domain-containing protein 2-like n=1 Tax=Ananas comosus var. bracteatus TaxID=296719 RepID=A0A6V7P5R6_ANACO|nr:unnamed protein product [Ananas comosus var. bracteatus]